MIYKKFSLRVLTLAGLALGVLTLTMAMLTLVQAADPAITIVKEADQVVVSGSTATFTIAVTNTGDVTLTNVTVVDALAPDCSRTVGILPDLAPGASTNYGCSRANVTTDFTNSATVTGTDTLSGTSVSSADTASVDVINPTIAIAKTPDEQTIVSGTTATFTIAITNTGDVTLTNVTVSDGLAPDCNRTVGILPELTPQESTSYECTLASVTTDFTNSATVTGTDTLLATDATATDMAFVDVINPTIGIAKMPDVQTIVSGATTTFTIAITNTGDVTLTNVIVSDPLAPLCDQGPGALPELAPQEGTSYECSLANVVTGFTNSATVTGTDTLLFTDVSTTDTADVNVIAPDIDVEKSPAEQTVDSGSNVSFTITMENNGDVDLTDVALDDPQCDTLTLDDDGNGDATLSPSEDWTYTCRVNDVGDGFINSVTVTGTDTLLTTDVTDADAAKVKLSETLPCPTDMLAYWKLDEAGGPAYDDFYDGHDGECAGSCPAPVTGRVNGGQEFDGSNTGIDVSPVPGDDSFDWGPTDSFSIEFWMRRPGTPTENEVIVGRDDSATGLHWWAGVGHRSGDVAVFCLYDTGGTGTCVTGEEIVIGGDWHHIVAVNDAITNELRIYVDGEEGGSVESPSYSAGFDSAMAALNIGWLDLSSGFHFDGTVDEVALYDRALSPDEIRQHHNEGLVERWYCQTGTYAPTIVSTPVTEATTGRLYTYDVKAAGSPVPTYTLVVSPSGMTIDPVTGLISWTPTMAQEGDHSVQVQASNSEGADTQNFTITVYKGTLCPTEILAYWKLDESFGPTYYDFYDGHDGACTGSCPAPTPAGHINRAQVFDGSNTGIDVPADAEFDWGSTDSFSIEFWMQTDSACSGSNEVVIGRRSSSTNPTWWVGCQNGGEAAFYLADANGTSAFVTGTTVTDGLWHHVVAVRSVSENRIRIYVDGGDSSVPITYAAGFASSAALNIGWLDNTSSGYHFDGTIDEVALYDRVLSSSEISQHYNGGEAGPGYCINPEIAVNKTASSETVCPGEWVTYTYRLTNPGDDQLSAVGVSDDKCSPVSFVVGGDSNGNDELDPGETWTYTCAMAISADITNTVIVTGTHSLDGTVNGTDLAFVNVTNSTVFLPLVLRE